MVWTDEDRRRLWAEQAARQRAEMAAAAARRENERAQQQAAAKEREKKFRERIEWINQQNLQNQKNWSGTYPIRRDPVDSFPPPKPKSLGGLVLGVLFLIAVVMILGHSDGPSTRSSYSPPETTFEPPPPRLVPQYVPAPTESVPAESSDITPTVSSAPPLEPYPRSANRRADVPTANSDAQTIASTPLHVPSRPVEEAPIALQVIRRVMPAYPPLARQVRVEGPVELSVEVAPDGSVRDVRVISGFALLNQAAIDAVRQWRYQPFAGAGQDTQRTQVTVNFRLN